MKCEDLKLWRLNSRTQSGEYVIQLFVFFTLEAKLVSSKHLIQVHWEILSRSVRKHGFTIVDKVYYLM